MGRIPLTLAFVAAQAIWVGTAVGQESPSIEEESREYLERAILHVQEGDVWEAIESFEAAFSIAPQPVILYNIARCYEQLDEPSAAWDAYERYLKAASRLRSERERVRRTKASQTELKPKLFGGLEVTCVQKRATVDAGDHGKGRCPFRRASVRAGRVSMVVAAKGHVDWIGTLVVSAGTTLHKIVDLKPRVGRLLVRCGVPGCTLTVDEQDFGAIPVDDVAIAAVPPGPHHVTVKAPLYLDWEHDVAVTTDGRVQVQALLEPAPVAEPVPVGADPDEASGGSFDYVKEWDGEPVLVGAPGPGASATATAPPAEPFSPSARPGAAPLPPTALPSVSAIPTARTRGRSAGGRGSAESAGAAGRAGSVGSAAARPDNDLMPFPARTPPRSK